MTLVMTSLPLARTCFHVFFTCSCKLSFLFPPRSQNPPESLLADFLLDGTRRSGARNTKRLHHSKAKLFSFLFKVALRCLPSSKVFLYHETFSGKGYIGVTVLKKKMLGTLNVSRCKLMKMSATLKFTPLPFKSADFQLHKVVLSSELFKQQLATVIRSKT